MEKKARIIVYDDVGILDESDTLFEDKEQLAGIAKQNLSQTPDAEMVEVWAGSKLVMKFEYNRKHKIVHPRTCIQGGEDGETEQEHRARALKPLRIG